MGCMYYTSVPSVQHLSVLYVYILVYMYVEMTLSVQI